MAVLTTLWVMTGELALVTFHSSNSQGITCSIWYLRRSATFVTSAGGREEGGMSERLEGSTGGIER